MVIVYVDLNPRERGIKQANRRVETRRLRPQICAVTPRRQPMANSFSRYQDLGRLMPVFQFQYGVRLLMYLKFVANAVVTLVYAANCGFMYSGGIATRFYKIVIRQFF